VKYGGVGEYRGEPSSGIFTLPVPWRSAGVDCWRNYPNQPAETLNDSYICMSNRAVSSRICISL
jgi:hypothetical protein